MKSVAIFTAIVLVGGLCLPVTAQPGGRRDFTDRDPEHEYFVCLAEDELNYRLVYNQRDANFCENVIRGEVVLLPAPEAGQYLGVSRIICYQRTVLCIYGYGTR